MKTNLLLAIGLSTSIFAAQCNINSSSLEWMAFKTPAKAGVKGTFDDIKLNFSNASSLDELLRSASIKIATAKVNTNNKGRDEKLVQSFFEVQGVKHIDAKIVDIKDHTAKVEISMNGVKRAVPMKIIVLKESMKLKGVIDLADFSMLPSLKAINKACFDLHQGKTWQDVELEFNILTSCK